MAEGVTVISVHNDFQLACKAKQDYIDYLDGYVTDAYNTVYIKESSSGFGWVVYTTEKDTYVSRRYNLSHMF